MIKVKDRAQITITGMTQSGEGVGRIENKTVFVEDAVPGDIVSVEIVGDKRTYFKGKCLELVQVSPDRVTPECPYFPACGGCQLMHMDYQAQLRFKTQTVADALARIGGLKNIEVLPAIGMKNPRRYRNKAQYKVSREGVGFYAKGSHEVVPVADCLTEPKNCAQVITAFNQFIKTANITLYNETTHKGYLRGIVQRTNRDGETMLVVIINKEKVKLKDTMVQTILKRVPGVKSIYANINTAHSNVVLGKKNILLYGEEKLTETIGSCTYLISPNSFFQVNSGQTEVLYDQVKALAKLTGQEVVFDLYCGTGTIGIYLADQAKEVYGIEIVEDAVRDAKENARLNNCANAFFFAGKSEIEAPKLVASGIVPDLVILDPPRKGCDEKLLAMIGEIKTPRLIYVSCNPATLARDMKILAGYGYQVKQVQPVDVFGETGHVETVVLLSKGEIDSKKVRVEFSLEDMDMSGFQNHIWTD